MLGNEMHNVQFARFVRELRAGRDQAAILFSQHAGNGQTLRPDC